MRFGLRILVVLTTSVTTYTSIVHAQSIMDPSSALLLNGSSDGSAKSHSSEPRLDSGRYTVRPRSEKSGTEKSGKKPVDASAVTPSSTPTSTPAASVTPPPAAVTSSTVLLPGESGAVVIPDAPPVIVHMPDANPAAPATDKTAAKEVAPSADDLIEASIATAYVYESSESGYSFRQWTMNSPAYVIRARAWLNPELGMGAKYLSTMGGQVGDRPTATTTSAVAASRTETAFGLFLKKVFDNSNAVFGIEMVDSQFKVASETVSKVKTKSSGIRLSVESEFANMHGDKSWRAGFSVTPKIEHEESTAAAYARSGTGVSAYAVGASLEHRWIFDRSNAFHIRLEHTIERDLFTGPAAASDPLTGATPNGVAVTTGTTLIQFGYSWGN